MGDQQRLSAEEEEKNVAIAVAVAQTEPNSDSAGEVGGNGKHPCMSSIDQEDGLLVSDYKKVKLDSAGEVGEVRGNGNRPCTGSFDQEDGALVSDYKNVKIEESSMTGDVVLPCGISPSADESLGDSKMKIIHDEVDDYIKSCFGKGNYRDLHNKLKNEKGVWADHLRAVVRAKISKRKRGESDNTEDLCKIPSLADEGLTYTEIFKLRSHILDHLRPNLDQEALWGEAQKKGVYGAYVRALIRDPVAHFFDILVDIMKEGIFLNYLAMAVTETSFSEVKQWSSSLISRLDFLSIMPRKELWEKKSVNASV